MIKIFSILITIFLASCSANLESPVIYFSNASDEEIKNIQCDWASREELLLSSLNPGESRSQSFYMRSFPDFFGLVKISWRNSKGERIAREFYFKDNNLPSIEDDTTYNYVQFYLDQEEFEIVSSDAPDLAGKTRKMEKQLALYNMQYKAKYHGEAPQSSLISVQDKIQGKDRSVPYWLSNSF